MTTTSTTSGAVPIDSICHVLHTNQHPRGLGIQVWARAESIPGPIVQFAVRSGTLIGTKGRLVGWRDTTAQSLTSQKLADGLHSIAREYYPVDVVTSWTPERSVSSPPAPAPSTTNIVSPFQASNLPVSVVISAGSRWQKNGREIEVLEATSQGFDAILKVRVVKTSRAKGAAKKISVRSLITRYTPVP